jgi:hypothetical protein
MAKGLRRTGEQWRPALENVGQPSSAAICGGTRLCTIECSLRRLELPGAFHSMCSYHCSANDSRGRLPHILRRAVSHWPFALLGFVFLSGCKPAPPPAPPTVSDSAERGPIRFSVEVSPKDAWIGDPITVSLLAATPEDLEVQFPPADALGEVNVRSSGEPESRPAQSGSTWKRTYVFDTLTAGTLEIPPLVMKYGRTAADGAETKFDNELALGTLKIDVRSALTSQDSMVAPRDITGARGPTPAPWTWWQIMLLTAWSALALAAAASLLRVWQRRMRQSRRPVKPEEWALAALADLGKFDWIAADEARELYYRLTEVVRGYIESKFGLKAPEMTTEEFLVALARNRAALPYDTAKLGQFLEACDMVKYAAVSPRHEDAGDALSTARAFVHSTAAAVVQAQAAAEEPPTSPPPIPHDDSHLASEFEPDDERRWMGARSGSGGRAA